MQKSSKKASTSADVLLQENKWNARTSSCVIEVRGQKRELSQRQGGKLTDFCVGIGKSKKIGRDGEMLEMGFWKKKGAMDRW